MGNCPSAYLQCQSCQQITRLPVLHAPKFYRYRGFPFSASASAQLASASGAGTPNTDQMVELDVPILQCLGFCQECQCLVGVEDFSEPVSALQRYWQTEQAIVRLQQKPWLQRIWQKTAQQVAELMVIKQHIELLLFIRAQPNRPARCLECASTHITPYPAYHSRMSDVSHQYYLKFGSRIGWDSENFERVPFIHQGCGGVYQMNWSPVVGHYCSAPIYYDINYPLHP